MEIIQRVGSAWNLLLCLSLYFINGILIYNLFTRFAAVKSKWIWKLLLYLVFVLSSAMVIWVGDHNLILTFLCYLPMCLWCTKGSRYGRLAVIFIFFCMEMSVCAMMDTYFDFASLYDYHFAVRIGRTAVYAAVWLCLGKRLPEGEILLSDRLWRMIFGLSVMPLCSMLAVVSLTDETFFGSVEYSVVRNLGLAVLPFTFLTSFVILGAIVAFMNYEKLEKAQQIYEMREAYYLSLKQQEKSIRLLRHDMRNHLAAISALLAGGKTKQAVNYLQDLLDSRALQGCGRFCPNETANAVLQAKAEEITQMGMEYEFRAEIPENLSVSDIDLCSLIGNALDNAIRAAVSASDHRINLWCRCDKGLLMLKVTNAFAGELEENLNTTKPDKEHHGMGLLRMREIAAQYGGQLETNITDHRFELVVFLPL